MAVAREKVDYKGCVDVGNELKKQRRQLKLSVAQVSEELKIRRIYIIAIENGDIESLPSTVYLTGYIKSYANFLDRDPKPLLEKIKEPELEHKSMANDDIISEEHFLPSKLIIGICIALLLIIYITLRH